MRSLLLFPLNVLPVVIAIAVYLLWIRPTIRNLPHIKEFYDEADSVRLKVWLWIRVQWDGLVGVVLTLWPSIPDILQLISGADLSALVPSDATKAINQLIGVALIVFKAVALAKTKQPG